MAQYYFGIRAGCPEIETFPVLNGVQTCSPTLVFSGSWGLASDYAYASNAKVTNGGAIPPFTKTPSWHDAYLIAGKGSFRCYLST
jgi:hypothetical protein